MTNLELGFAFMGLSYTLWLCYLVYYGNRRLSDGEGSVMYITFYFAFVCIFWTLITGVLAEFGVFGQADGEFPLVFLTLLVPLVCLLVLIFVLPSFGPWLSKLPLSYLAGGQAMRVLAAYLLYELYRHGQAPLAITYITKPYDLLFGLTALPLAVYLHKNVNHWLNLAWNAVGLWILLYMVYVQAITFSPLQYGLSLAVRNDAITRFPFVWLVSVVFVVASYQHIFSLMHSVHRLRQAAFLRKLRR